MSEATMFTTSTQVVRVRLEPRYVVRGPLERFLVDRVLGSGELYRHAFLAGMALGAFVFCW